MNDQRATPREIDLAAYRALQWTNNPTVLPPDQWCERLRADSTLMATLPSDVLDKDRLLLETISRLQQSGSVIKIAFTIYTTSQIVDDPSRPLLSHVSFAINGLFNEAVKTTGSAAVERILEFPRVAQYAAQCGKPISTSDIKETIETLFEEGAVMIYPYWQLIPNGYRAIA